jgi:hypothetical protein
MNKRVISVMVILLLILVSASTVQAQKQSWNMNIKGGLMLPGTVTVEGYDGDTEMGWIGNLAFDALLAEKVSMGGYLFYSGITAEDIDEGANILGIGGTIKARFTLKGGTQIRPGVILAYQMTSGDAFEDVTGFGVGFTGEVVFPLKDFNAIVAEIGFTSQPSGGNEDVEVTWSPIFYLTLGYEFGG